MSKRYVIVQEPPQNITVTVANPRSTTPVGRPSTRRGLGAVLNGLVLSLADDGAYLSGIARSALRGGGK